LKHLADEPWWMALFSTFGLGTARLRRDSVFCAGVLSQEGISISANAINAYDQTAITHSIAQHLTSSDRAANDRKRFVETCLARVNQYIGTVQQLREWMPGNTDITVTALQAALDIGPRFRAFKLATHYWEARYLLELQTHFRKFPTLDNSKSPVKLQALYARLSKLHPCFVTTLHTLPDRFIGYPNQTDAQALFGLIDLLIVDEAGQVSPEICVPSFALAKRALVVMDQMHCIAVSLILRVS
jgi:hypothetical protein